MHQTTHYRSVFISDIHLGTKGCKADALCDFLKHTTCDNLFLVGDIIDGWRLSRKVYWPQSHTNVVRRILTAAKRDTHVIYIVGNHDEALRETLQYDLSFGNIEIKNHHRHYGVDGKQYIVIHGDMFDTALRGHLKFLYHLGDFAYGILLDINNALAWIRRKLGMKYWSLSAYLKHKTKEAVSFMSDFEDLIAGYCKNKHADGIICGHIHKAVIKDINGITYMNDGDWVESCSALVEHTNGRWELIYWNDVQKL
jgi:UDP-2,3-diacylglucosamine pyrophosphatase LpxH